MLSSWTRICRESLLMLTWPAHGRGLTKIHSIQTGDGQLRLTVAPAEAPAMARTAAAGTHKATYSQVWSRVPQATRRFEHDPESSTATQRLREGKDRNHRAQQGQERPSPVGAIISHVVKVDGAACMMLFQGRQFEGNQHVEQLQSRFPPAWHASTGWPEQESQRVDLSPWSEAVTKNT